MRCVRERSAAACGAGRTACEWMVVLSDVEQRRGGTRIASGAVKYARVVLSVYSEAVSGAVS